MCQCQMVKNWIDTDLYIHTPIRYPDLGAPPGVVLEEQNRMVGKNGGAW